MRKNGRSQRKPATRVLSADRRFRRGSIGARPRTGRKAYHYRTDATARWRRLNRSAGQRAVARAQRRSTNSYAPATDPDHPCAAAPFVMARARMSGHFRPPRVISTSGSSHLQLRKARKAVHTHQCAVLIFSRMPTRIPSKIYCVESAISSMPSKREITFMPVRPSALAMPLAKAMMMTPEISVT